MAVRTKVYYDAENVALGRIGSVVCKELLKGKEVFVINAEKAIITGNFDDVVGTVSNWKGKGGKGMKGPKVSRYPHLLMKRMIRGMLPWDRTKGKEAYDRLRCYIGNGDLKQEELKNVKKIETKKYLKFVTVKDVAQYM